MPDEQVTRVVQTQATPEEFIRAVATQARDSSDDREGYIRYSLGAGQEFMVNVRAPVAAIAEVIAHAERLFDKWLSAHMQGGHDDGTQGSGEAGTGVSIYS